ncbi:MAG: trypsin-like peptidase domain-containing protein [Gemmataceae bacterium]
MRTHRTLLAAVAVGTVLSPFGTAARARADVALPPLAGRPASDPTRAWNPRQSPVVDVVRQVKAAVVNIHSERTVKANGIDEFLALAPSQHRVNGMGTGIVIDPRGYIVTNQHVVEDVSLLRVRLADGSSVGARVVARDVESDLALLKITPPKPLAVMPLGTTRDLQVGETVVAVGNAYGYDHTVTVGVVVAVGRDVSLNKDIRYSALIQTDASINPGNSGGPLINLDGELVGVNVAIRAGAQGIGFAIPVDSMITVAGAMLAKVREAGGVGLVGLAVQDEVTRNSTSRRVIVEPRRRPGGEGGRAAATWWWKVADPPGAEQPRRGAGAAGTRGRQQAGRGRPPRRQRASASAWALEAARRDTRLAASSASTAGATTPAAAQMWRQFGLRVQTLGNPAEITTAFPQLHGGLVIDGVRPDSLAARAGLRNGDVLVGLHQWEMLTADNVVFVLNHPERHTFTPIRFFIVRGNQIHRGWLTAAD